MSNDPTTAQALNGAAADADANAGAGNVGDPTAGCTGPSSAGPSPSSGRSSSLSSRGSSSSSGRSSSSSGSSRSSSSSGSSSSSSSSGTASLWLHLAVSMIEAPNYPGSLHVKGSTGYDRTLLISENFVTDGAAEIDIEFKGVPRSGTYSVSYVDSDGEESLIFKDFPYGALQDPNAPKG